MTNSKTTKRALLTSVMALVLCFAMLTGTTLAWFTDTETSSGNKIVAGNLDVQLLMWDGDSYEEITDESAPIFGANSLIAQNNPADTLWEPGKTQVAYLAIRNIGNLALKYNVIVNVTDNGLIGALEYAIVPVQGGTADATTLEQSKWADIKANYESGLLAEGKTIAAPDGCLDEVRNGYEQNKNETDYFALVIHMDENAGNEYKSDDEEKNVVIDIIVNATQVEAEADSFGKDYDKDAFYADAYASNPDDLKDALASGAAIVGIADDMTVAVKSLKESSSDDLTVALAADTTVTVSSGISTGSSAASKDLTFTGDKTSTVVLQGYSSTNKLSYLDGVNLTFKGITFDANEISGICARGGVVTFEDCFITGELEQTIASKFVFSGCTFDVGVTQVGYGCTDVVFEECTFKTDGYGIKIYKEANANNVNLTVKNCSFKNTGSDARSAILLDHIKDGYTYNINVEGCQFEGYTATPTATYNQWAAREIVTSSFVKDGDQYVFSYQTGEEGGNYHKILTDSQLVVTVK